MVGFRIEPASVGWWLRISDLGFACDGGAILRSVARRNYHAHCVFDPPTGGGYRLCPFPSREVGVRPCTLPESTEPLSPADS
jgi:hypothetical protein